MSKFIIKEAKIKDLDTIFKLIKELALYEKMDKDFVATKKDYEKNIFENQYAKILILEFEKNIIGYAIYFFTFSSFLGSGGIWLEDLYIKQEFRRKGFGKEVFKYIAKKCEENNLKRLEWVCLNDNDIGINFYESLKAQNMNIKWKTYRLDEANLKKLINE